MSKENSYMDEVYEIKAQMSQKAKDMTKEEIIALSRRVGEEFDRYMAELKKKWATEKEIKKVAINQ